MSDQLLNLSNAMAEAVETAGQSVLRVEARRRLPASGIVWDDSGVIVTAHHVVQREDGIGVGLPDGSKTTAKFIGRDPSTDIAVLKADDLKLDAPTWLPMEQIKVGHLILALALMPAWVLSVRWRIEFPVPVWVIWMPSCKLTWLCTLDLAGAH